MAPTDNTKRAALKLLRNGKASLVELAALAKTSRQLVRYWAIADGIDFEAARARYLAKLWQKTLERQG